MRALRTDDARFAVAAYDAPCPHQRFKAGVRSFKGLVPTGPDQPEALARLLNQFIAETPAETP